VLAAALVAAHGEANGSEPPWRLVPRGDDPGVDAMADLERRPADPNVLSTCTPVFLQAPLLRGLTLTHRQLTPIARLVADRYLLVARADSSWPSATDFLADISRRPTRTGGYFKGGINHLLALAISEAAGADVAFIVVPSEPAVWVELMTGGLDWGCGVAAEVLPHLEAGTLRPIAALDEKRLPGFPNVPTLAEAGAPVSFKLWRGLMGPPGLSDADEVRWHAAIGRLRQTRAWKSYLQRNRQTDDFLAGEPFKAFLESEWAWYEKHLGLARLLPVSA
jgi:putative tricarboxylic transport membrane protein